MKYWLLSLFPQQKLCLRGFGQIALGQEELSHIEFCAKALIPLLAIHQHQLPNKKLFS
jgi:hypothetical protein